MVDNKSENCRYLCRVYRGTQNFMEAFLSFLFFVIVGFYVVGAVSRWLLRRWIGRKQQEFAERFGGGQGGGFRGYSWNSGARTRSSSREGEVTVQQTAQTPKKRVSGTVGDYVEFEEISAREPDRAESSHSS